MGMKFFGAQKAGRFKQVFNQAVKFQKRHQASGPYSF